MHTYIYLYEYIYILHPPCLFLCDSQTQAHNFTHTCKHTHVQIDVLMRVASKTMGGGGAQEEDGGGGGGGGQEAAVLSAQKHRGRCSM